MIICNVLFYILVIQMLSTACYTTFTIFTSVNFNSMFLFGKDICIYNSIIFFFLADKLFTLIHRRSKLTSHQHP